ncbi:MAG: tetratricopeptide repeat protein, partial [Bacteroidetes bacterium]|nr:tetratricopeptide repeat protein [Bacteroidota bacterium]
MNELHNLIEHCNALYEQEKFEDLIVSVENGLASFPNSHELYLIKGKANNKLGNTENAISDYTNAIQIKPDFCKAYYLRGNQFKNLEEYKKAIDDYERAIQLDPDYSNAYYQIGNINLYVFNNEDIAETYFGKSIEINNDTDSLFCRGQIYLYQGKETEALNDFNKIIELDSEFLGAYYFRGQIFNNQQEYKKAIEDLNKAFDYYSDNSEYFYILADCHSS